MHPSALFKTYITFPYRVWILREPYPVIRGSEDGVNKNKNKLDYWFYTSLLRLTPSMNMHLKRKALSAHCRCIQWHWWQLDSGALAFCSDSLERCFHTWLDKYIIFAGAQLFSAVENIFCMCWHNVSFLLCNYLASRTFAKNLKSIRMSAIFFLQLWTPRFIKANKHKGRGESLTPVSAVCVQASSRGSDVATQTHARRPAYAHAHAHTHIHTGIHTHTHAHTSAHAHRHIHTMQRRGHK